MSTKNTDESKTNVDNNSTNLVEKDLLNSTNIVSSTSDTNNVQEDVNLSSESTDESQESKKNDFTQEELELYNQIKSRRLDRKKRFKQSILDIKDSTKRFYETEQEIQLELKENDKKNDEDLKDLVKNIHETRKKKECSQDEIESSLEEDLDEDVSEDVDQDKVAQDINSQDEYDDFGLVDVNSLDDKNNTDKTLEELRVENQEIEKVNESSASFSEDLKENELSLENEISLKEEELAAEKVQLEEEDDNSLKLEETVETQEEEQEKGIQEAEVLENSEMQEEAKVDLKEEPIVFFAAEEDELVWTAVNDSIGKAEFNQDNLIEFSDFDTEDNDLVLKEREEATKVKTSFSEYLVTDVESSRPSQYAISFKEHEREDSLQRDKYFFKDNSLKYEISKYPICAVERRISAKEYFKSIYLTLKSPDYALNNILKDTILADLKRKNRVKFSTRVHFRFFWILISFIFPLLGFLLYGVFSNTKYNLAKICLRSAIVSITFYIYIILAFAFFVIGILPSAFI